MFGKKTGNAVLARNRLHAGPLRAADHRIGWDAAGVKGAGIRWYALPFGAAQSVEPGLFEYMPELG